MSIRADRDREPDPLGAAYKAEHRLDFYQAFRLLSEVAADADPPIKLLASIARADPVEDAGNDRTLFHAVRDLERSEAWRLVSALWEYIGDRLGDRVKGDPLPGLYYGMSLTVDYWRDPRSDDKPAGYYGDIRDQNSAERKRRLAHARALAYGHGAEEAAANNRFALATLLRRKAALAWIMSGWGDRGPKDAKGKWGREELLDVSGGKWREAARAYFRAAVFENRASSEDEKGLTFQKYRPGKHEPMRWPKSPRNRRRKRRLKFFFDERDDIDRMKQCWREWAKDRRKAFNQDSQNRISRWCARWNIQRRANEALCESLSVLEEALRAAGRGPEARKLFRQKRIANLSAEGAMILERVSALFSSAPKYWPEDEREALSKGLLRRLWRFGLGVFGVPRVAFGWLYHWLTGSGTSILGTLACLAVVFAGAIPALFLSHQALVYCSSAGHCAGHVHRYVDALRFSVSQALTVSPSDLAPKGSFGQWLAVLDTLFAAFSLGYAIWVITRNSP